MFRAGQPNPYDDIVAKTTDENLTAENWEFILNLCDKVQDEGEIGARNVIAAILKRLAHRNSNVQLYTLSLAESLSKNCTITLHREIASKAFTQGLEKIITDRTTHEKVRRRALGLIEMWTAEFEHDPTLGVMEECCNSLRAKNYKFEAPSEPAPPSVNDEVRRKEEEELQRALELSVQDKGGRSQWEAYSLASSSGASGSNSRLPGPSGAGPSPSSGQTYSAPPASSGYVPTSSVPPQVHTPTSEPPAAATKSYGEANIPVPVSSTDQTPATLVTRVRALHNFDPTEPGELAFQKGDIIKVVDRGYKDWWRGQLKGRTGIFPVNYVEHMAEPTAAELAKEAEKEAAVFSQAVDVDRLLTLLKAMDPSKDNLADNEEIQELYRSCMALRPKIVKLIDKYSQKRADLVSMNESFVKARNIFDGMMEESLARHTQMYGPEYVHPQFARARTESIVGSPQPYGWGSPVYEQSGYYSAPGAATYQQPPGQDLYNGQPPHFHPQQQSPNAYQPPPQQQQSGNNYQPPAGYVDPNPGGYSGNPGHVYGQQPAGYDTQPSPPAHPQPQGGHQLQGAPRQPHSPGLQGLPPQAQAVPSQEQHQVAQPQQLQTQVQTQSQPQQEAQTQAHSPTLQSQQAGPPYIYDPTTHYSDSNVQAWAQYYAQGGKDPIGAVYFISVPGVKEPAPAPVASVSQESVGLSHRSQVGYPQRRASAPTGGSFDEELSNPYEEESNLQNPYDSPGGAPATTVVDSTEPGYGASPYHGLTRDMAGLDLAGSGGTDGNRRQGPDRFGGYGQPIAGQ